MPLVTFYQIFKIIDEKTLEFVHDTKIGGVEFNKGQQISKGVIIAGIDFFKYIGNEIEVKEEDGAYVVEKVYV